MHNLDHRWSAGKITWWKISSSAGCTDESSLKPSSRPPPPPSSSWSLLGCIRTFSFRCRLPSSRVIPPALAFLLSGSPPLATRWWSALVFRQPGYRIPWNSRRLGIIDREARPVMGLFSACGLSSRGLVGLAAFRSTGLASPIIPLCSRVLLAFLCGSLWALQSKYPFSPNFHSKGLSLRSNFLSLNHTSPSFPWWQQN